MRQGEGMRVCVCTSRSSYGKGVFEVGKNSGRGGGSYYMMTMYDKGEEL